MKWSNFIWTIKNLFKYKKLLDFGIDSIYEHLEHDKIGKGAYGTVYKTKERASGLIVAVKVFKRPIPSESVESLRKEVEIQAMLENHSNITRILEVILTKTHLCLVLEYAYGGTLSNYVDRNSKINQTDWNLCIDENEARLHFQQLISAIDHCHKNKVIHRDLKLDNVLMTYGYPQTIKVCDFGLAEKWNSGALITGCVGTAVYMSPEITSNQEIINSYDGTLADVWALGIILFAMFTGSFPFDLFYQPQETFTESQLIKEIRTQQSYFNWKDCRGSPFEVKRHVKSLLNFLTPQCQDLLDRMLIKTEKNRITIKEIKKHPWVTKTNDPHNDNQYLLDKIMISNAFSRRTKLINYLFSKIESEDYKLSSTYNGYNFIVFNGMKILRINLRSGVADIDPDI